MSATVFPETAPVVFPAFCSASHGDDAGACGCDGIRTWFNCPVCDVEVSADECVGLIDHAVTVRPISRGGEPSDATVCVCSTSCAVDFLSGSCVLCKCEVPEAEREVFRFAIAHGTCVRRLANALQLEQGARRAAGASS